MKMEIRSKFDERTGWGYVWVSSEWKPQFLVLTPGALKVFSCEQRYRMEKNLSLLKCSVELYEPFQSSSSSSSSSSLSSTSSSSWSPSSSSSLASAEVKVPKYRSKKEMWKSLAKLVFSDKNFSPPFVTVLTIKLRRGKSCFLMFPSQEEAETWKRGLEEGAILVEMGTKDLKKSSKRNNALQQASDAIEQTRRLFFKSQSLLKIPFGLRWEAYPPLFKVRQPISPPSFMSEGRSTRIMNAKVDVYDDDDKMGKSLWPDLETLSGCTDFLSSSCLNYRALEQATLMICHFKGSYQMGDADLPDEFRLEAWKGTTRRIVQALVDQLIASNPSLEHCVNDEELQDQLWSASEVWVFGAVHDKIMGACKQMFMLQDASMDNVLAKLEKVDSAKLGVRAEFEIFVIGEAMEEFRQLNRLRSPYEKALCLQKTVRCIVNGIQNLIKSCSGTLNDADGVLPCTDDLLSFMLLLMARAKVKNLHANACYMENFINLQKDTNRGELMYHITNFVAACSYLLSDDVRELVVDIADDSGTQAINHAQSSPASMKEGNQRLATSSLKSNMGNITDEQLEAIAADEQLEPITDLASSPGNSSLGSNTNPSKPRDYRWDSSAFLPSLGREAFDRSRNGGCLTSGEDEIRGSLEQSTTLLTDCEQFRGIDLIEDVAAANEMIANWKGTFTHLGNSPEFLLASTYQ